ncbi:MAG: type IV pilus secretin PilQ [Acidobacteriota bacterium]
MERHVRIGPRARAARASVWMLAAVVAAGTVGANTDPRPTAAAPRAILKTISTEIDGSRSRVLIESSEPVAYVTTQPDPLTVLVDLRNVRAGELPSGILGPLPPVSHVAVEEAVAGDGAELARVRVRLAYPATHRVRSTKNVIVVEVDRSSGAETPLSPAPAVVAVRTAAQAPPAPPVVGQAAPPPTSQTPRFTGHAVTLDFQGADLRSVLRTFAEISGLNIVIDPTIAGSVDVALRDVPWDQALDIILKANKLGYAVDGTVVRIAPLNVLAQEEEDRRRLADAQALSGELRVLTWPLSYAKAPELVPILTRSALSARGEVQVDTRTNTLIVRDLQERLTTAEDLIKALDLPQPQVEIEARIVQTTRDFARAIGVEWGFNGRIDPALGNTTNLAFPNNGSVRGATGGGQGPVGGSTDTGVNLRAPAASSAVGIALGAVNGALNLDLVLSQLESTGRGRLLSTPRVSTQNNVEAEMTQGVQIPIQTVANNTVTVNFKDAALTLRVTPQITASSTIIMRVFLENATPDFSRAVNGIPPIDTQRAVTTVLVADGETTVIGGIYVSIEQASNDRVPLMHRIPLLGWLFKRDQVSDESRELLIFITPRITKG